MAKVFPAEAHFPAPFEWVAFAVNRNVYYYSAARRPAGFAAQESTGGRAGDSTVVICT